MFYISCFALLSCFHCFDLHFWDCMPDFDTYFYSPFLWDYVPYLYISTIYISLRLFAVFVYFPGSHFFEIFCRICIFLWFTFLWDCLPYLYISLVHISLRLFAVFGYFSPRGKQMPANMSPGAASAPPSLQRTAQKKTNLQKHKWKKCRYNKYTKSGPNDCCQYLTAPCR